MPIAFLKLEQETAMPLTSQTVTVRADAHSLHEVIAVHTSSRRRSSMPRRLTAIRTAARTLPTTIRSMCWRNKPDDPVRSELIGYINALSEDEQIELVALAWLGRGT
jgi:hypothetical protein